MEASLRCAKINRSFWQCFCLVLSAWDLLQWSCVLCPLVLIFCALSIACLPLNRQYHHNPAIWPCILPAIANFLHLTSQYYHLLSCGTWELWNLLIWEYKCDLLLLGLPGSCVAWRREQVSGRSWDFKEIWTKMDSSYSSEEENDSVTGGDVVVERGKEGNNIFKGPLGTWKASHFSHSCVKCHVSNCIVGRTWPCIDNYMGTCITQIHTAYLIAQGFGVQRNL